MRVSYCALALTFAFAAACAALAEAASAECGPATAAKMPPDAGPYMPGLKMNEPMPGQMKRDDMIVGDVAKSAEQKQKCMDEAMKLEEERMDGRKR